MLKYSVGDAMVDVELKLAGVVFGNQESPLWSLGEGAGKGKTPHATQ